jgi:hypothetical protein
MSSDRLPVITIARGCYANNFYGVVNYRAILSAVAEPLTRREKHPTRSARFLGAAMLASKARSEYALGCGMHPATFFQKTVVIYPN